MVTVDQLLEMSAEDFKALCVRLDIGMIAARRVPGSGSGDWQILLQTRRGELVVRGKTMAAALVDALNATARTLS
jgi:hypothetical protein